MYKHIYTFNIVLGVDLIPMAVTFLACLGGGLDCGMLIGTGVNLMFILYNSARPKVRVRNLIVSILFEKYNLLNWK
jgi:F0F1-type ATP synthase membrane subunit c/vacuolar-type H+-ATPase subunit K